MSWWSFNAFNDVLNDWAPNIMYLGMYELISTFVVRYIFNFSRHTWKKTCNAHCSFQKISRSWPHFCEKIIILVPTLILFVVNLRWVDSTSVKDLPHIQTHLRTIGTATITQIHHARKGGEFFPLPKLCSLFRNKRFILDEMTRWNASIFAIFYIYENQSCLVLVFTNTVRVCAGAAHTQISYRYQEH